jgi:hypothetical protein
VDKVNITVRVTNNYGIQTVYPVCEIARKLAALAGTKTLTPQAMRLIKDLGYTTLVEEQRLYIQPNLT